MEVHIVMEDGSVEKIEDVMRIEVDKKRGNRIAIYQEHKSIKMPCCEFKSVIVKLNGR